MAVVTQDTDFLEVDRKYAGIVFITRPLGVGELTRELSAVLERFEAGEIANSVVYLPWE